MSIMKETDKIYHDTLSGFLTIPEYKTGALFLSVGRQPVRLPSFIKGKIKHYLQLELRHLRMAWEALNAKGYHVNVVLEVYLQHTLIFLPLILLSRRTTYICLHWNQQLAAHDTLKLVFLFYVKAYAAVCKTLKLVVFEADDYFLPNSLRISENAKIIIPMPCHPRFFPRISMGEISKTNEVVLGVVGMIRKDKGSRDEIIDSILDFICQDKKDVKYKLIVGFPFWSGVDDIECLRDNPLIELQDTASPDAYRECLNSIDILVTFFRKDKYFYRTSGIVNDGISSGCYIVAPDFPVIQHQINWPAKCGSAYSDYSQIGVAISECVEMFLSHGNTPHWEWRKQRESAVILHDLFENHSQRFRDGHEH